MANSHFEYIKLSVDKFLACRDISKGFVKFKCPHCPVTHLFPITCKSRLCPSCGYRYSMTWTENIQKHILNIEHRHVLFTIPEECRKFFFYDISLLSKLSADVNQVFKFIFHNISRKRKRKNKISEHSKYYFTDSDIVHYGLISVIHTFGRDLKWNPHIHAIVSSGGFNKNLKFKKMRYFNVDTIAEQ
ncbi:transposase zinc-binding domain-containing protein [uncultured Leptotrichia sp.]|uniref:transposase zinc-binding domain-containing protein n=1 Tax=uncultured Leptotrichia sp. TaxID=159271 RepID=UPI00345BC81C